MANRIVTATVTGETIKLSEKSAGAAGSYNAVSLAFEFDSAWDDTTKNVTFFNIFSKNPKTITLTTNLLVDGKYIVPIPAEPLEFAGEFPITVRGVELDTDGITAKRIIISAHTAMVAKESDIPSSEDAPVEPTPTQAEQLLAAVNSVTGMTVTAMTIPAETPASVVKSTNSDGTINLDFGIPRGLRGDTGAGGGLLPKIVVTVDSGSMVTATKGETVIIGTSDGTCVLDMPDYGTWNIVSSLNGETSTADVLIDTIKIYPIVMGYYHVYGFTINEAESNPATSVTYTDEATAFTKGSSAWDTSPLFANIKPCLFKDGAVVGYLQRNDYTKFENGTAADITSGSAGDVMVEIPKMAYYMEKTGSIITCKVYVGSEAQSVDSRYTYLPFSRDIEGDRDKIYIGAYLGYTLSTKLRSLSGKAPSATQKIGTFRTQAQANGTGYKQLPFYPLTLLQILYILKYGSLDSQTALGRGFVDGNSAAINTGGTNAKGFCFGETTGKLQMKIFGIEDFWGNLYQWIDGLFCDASRSILTTYKSFNDTGSGYLFNTSSGLGADVGGYMNASQGNSKAGFNAKATSGSASTYYADYPTLYTGFLPFFGGVWSDASIAGAFRLGVNASASAAGETIGARLCYI